MLLALRGAVAFLTRLPVGGGERAWTAFRRTPAAFPVAGLLVGALAGLPLLLPVPVPSAAACYLATLYLVTGAAHADGLADLGDAVVVHGDADRRREVLHDTATGVGGALALGVTLAVLALGALAVAGLGVGVGRSGALVPAAVRVVVATEVGAKAGMALLVCLGDPAHEGLGSAFVGESGAGDLLPVAALSLPAVVAPPPGALGALVAATLAGPAVALLVRRWAAARLGGVSGDVLGATNELGRAAALHAGVVAWTLW